MKMFGIPYQYRQVQYVIGDIVMILLSIYMGHLMRLGADAGNLWEILSTHTGSSLFFISVNMIVLYVADAYSSDLDFRKRQDIARLWVSISVTLPMQFLAYSVFPHGWWGRSIAVLSTLSLGVLLSSWRAFLCWFRPQPVFRERTLIVGAGQAGHLITNVIRGNAEYRGLYNILGFLDHPRAGNRRKGDSSDDDRLDLPSIGVPVLGSTPDLKRLVAEQHIDLVIVALRNSMSSELAKQLLECKAQGVRIEDMPTIYKRLTGKVPILHLSDAWLIFGPVFSGTNTVMAALERLADILISLVGLTLSAPIIAVAAVIVRLESKGPGFFLQERLGRNEAPFKIIKLRTMRQDAEVMTGAVWSQGNTDSRVTRVGRFLRRSRIDELPQFYNVLRGDMSILGPRPEREHFVNMLKERIPFYALRFSVKPGITGWAQVRYRYGASVEDAVEKLCYELYAIQEMSPVLYMLILLKTVQTMVLRPGS